MKLQILVFDYVYAYILYQDLLWEPISVVIKLFIQ